MLRLESKPTPATPARRLALAAGLLALAAVAATLEAPALADDAPAATAAVDAPPPFDPIYVPDSTTGIFAVHPAAASRAAGRDRLARWVRATFVAEFDRMARELDVDATRPDFLRVEFDRIESIVMAFTMTESRGLAQPGVRLHGIRTNGQAVRMVAPFDWLALLRQWRVQVEEVQDARGTYYRFRAPQPLPAPEVFYGFLPDDRTLVILDDQRSVEEQIRRAAPSAPAYLRGADWERARRGLLALVVDNRDDSFVQAYDLGRPDDAMVLPLFRGVDRWVVGLDAAPTPALHAEVMARSPEAAEATTKAIDGLVKLGLAAVEATPAPPGTKTAANRQTLLDLLGNLRARPEGASVAASAAGFGTVADLLGLIQFEEAKPPAEAR